MKIQSSPAAVFIVVVLCLMLTACGPKNDPSAPAPAHVPKAGATKSPYTHEYYLAVKQLGVQELKKKVKVGMKSEEVQEVLGNESGRDGTYAQGTLKYGRKDGTLKVTVSKSIVTGIDIDKP